MNPVGRVLEKRANVWIILDQQNTIVRLVQAALPRNELQAICVHAEAIWLSGD